MNKNFTEMHDLLNCAIAKEASDLHLVAHKPPLFRLNGELLVSDLPVLAPEHLSRIINSILSDRQKAVFDATQELDFTYHCMDDFHFRVNIHREKGNPAATIRIMANNIKPLTELGLPEVVKDLAKKHKGLILITGPAGSGKTTTLTAIIDFINTTRHCKIVTIEDPIEYVHQSKKSLIIQREVGSDTLSFGNALKYALRQDPDVVMIGEMRDLESISMALTTAETGHLVLATLHAPNTIETIHRIIDVYPPAQQEQIRVQLADALLAVIGQNLLTRKEVAGRILSTEILIATLSIRNMIRRKALYEIRGQLDMERASGMHTFEHSLSDLVKQGHITKEIAVEHAKYPNMLTC